MYTDIIRDTLIGRETSERFKADTRIQSLKGKMLSSGNGATRFDSDFLLVGWCLWRANTVGRDQADKDLDAFLNNDNINLDVAVWVLGVETSETLTITRDVHLVPIEKMPHSSEKEEFLRSSFHPDWRGLTPSAALVTRCTVKKIAIEGPAAANDDSSKLVLDAFGTLQAIASLLNCLPDACCLTGYSTTYKPPDVPFGPFGGGGGGYSVFDIVPRRTYRPTNVSAALISTLVEHFVSLPNISKFRFRRALHRFAQAKGRMDYADRSLDLGIALEMLLLNRDHEGEDAPRQLSLTFRLRGAWLVGRTSEERLAIYKILGKIYDLRSKVAHNGMSNELDKMDHAKREQMFKEHVSVAERIFQKLIIEGTPSDWSSIITGGSIEKVR